MPDVLPPHPTVLALLLDRASVPPRHLREPAPQPAVVDLAVAAAVRAPDHGGLRPWRFVVVEGEARSVLGDLLADSLARRASETPAERLAVERGKPFRAPMVVVAGAAIRHDHPGVPAWEQEAAAAAGTMSFLLALEAQGYGGVWLSSPALGDPAVKTALGFQETDTLLGFLYLGTPNPDRSRPERPSPESFVRHWTPARNAGVAGSG